MDLYRILGVKDEKLIEILVKNTTVEYFKKGEYLYHKGEYLNRIMILKDGIVKSCSYNEDGMELVYNIIYDHGFIVASLPTEITGISPAIHDNIAIYPTEIYSIPITLINQLIDTSKSFRDLFQNEQTKYFSYWQQEIDTFRSHHGYRLYKYMVENRTFIMANCRRDDLARYLDVEVRSIGAWKSRLKKEEPELYQLLLKAKRQ